MMGRAEGVGFILDDTNGLDREDGEDEQGGRDGGEDSGSEK